MTMLKYTSSYWLFTILAHFLRKKNYFKKSYANAVKGGINNIDPKVQHLRKTMKTNIQEEPPTLLKKLELLHPAHAQHRRGK